MEAIQWEKVSYSWEEKDKLFKEISLDLKGGLNSLIGQNGTGKSTFMLLSAGRILPNQGKILLLGKDTKEILSEEERNLRASFVYQNMEFETQEPIEPLFYKILEMGNIASGGDQLLKELKECLELDTLLHRKLQELSKGEMQRAILTFSLLYGSPLVFLDEPFFAMEEYQKDAALEYLRQYTEDSNIHIYLSIHQLNLSKKYCHRTLLFDKKGNLEYGLTEEMLQKERVEKAFDAPMDNLLKKESLFRESLGKKMSGENLGNVKVYD